MLHKKLLQDNGKMLFWLLALVINIITFLIIHYYIKPSRDSFVLHYNVIIGVDVLGKGTDLYRIPLIGVVLLVINVIVSKLVKSPGNFLGFLASVVSFSVSLILLVAVLFVLRVN